MIDSNKPVNTANAPSQGAKEQDSSDQDPMDARESSVRDREDVVVVREDTSSVREETSTRREAAVTLREEAAGLLELSRALLEAMPEAIVVVDQTTTMVLVNAQTERLFGYSRDELIGRPVEILMPERLRSGHRGHLASYFRAPYLRPMGAGMDLHAMQKEGQEFPVEISLSPIETNTGTLVISAIRDVTAQRAAQRTAREEREGIVAAREETAIRREREVDLRYEAADLRDERALLREDALRAREEAAQARSELPPLMAQLREANERLVVATVHAETMTEDAEQANRLKDEFLATVSHELRTPLSAVLGWVRMLASKQLPPDRAEHAIATIERNASILAHLIDDLLDVSRIAAGTLRLARQPVDLVAVTRAALDGVRPLAVAKNVQLEFSPDLSAMKTVGGDAGRLEQVMWNLLTNAVNFTPEGGRVDVFINLSTDHLEIRVVDTGQGISPDFLPHVFERFRQAEGATTRRHTGLGLGLAIVQQLVELHGGTVHAASQGVGRGATFTIRLPIAAVED